ncbi:MAG: NAD+ synthase, partial [Chloroflexota bacterium]|nr:NAD+ synthase [Chloroflexota bacterium]
YREAVMDYTSLAESLVVWLREYVRQAQLTGFVVGLSGGIDSAVSAALAVRAVGVENVLGAWLPCHSQPEDAAFARLTVESLGLEPLTVDLSATYDTLLVALSPGEVLGAPVQGNDMARANLKPRLRMATLYYLAQSRNALVLGTGNRAEMMVGYFTKYGDGGVDLEPLGELYKHEVRQLARVLDVPEPLITRPPTAGLWPGQTDEGELGITYDELDAILAALEAGREPQAPLAAVARVRRMAAVSVHKRAMPPAFPVERAGD